MPVVRRAARTRRTLWVAVYTLAIIAPLVLAHVAGPPGRSATAELASIASSPDGPGRIYATQLAAVGALCIVPPRSTAIRTALMAPATLASAALPLDVRAPAPWVQFAAYGVAIVSLLVWVPLKPRSGGSRPGRAAG